MNPLSHLAHLPRAGYLARALRGILGTSGSPSVSSRTAFPWYDRKHSRKTRKKKVNTHTQPKKTIVREPKTKKKQREGRRGCEVRLQYHTAYISISPLNTSTRHSKHFKITILYNHSFQTLGNVNTALRQVTYVLHTKNASPTHSYNNGKNVTTWDSPPMPAAKRLIRPARRRSNDRRVKEKKKSKSSVTAKLTACRSIDRYRGECFKHLGIFTLIIYRYRSLYVLPCTVYKGRYALARLLLGSIPMSH